MVTRIPAKKSGAAPEMQAPMPTAVPRERNPAGESATRAIASGRAAVKALKDAATGAGGAAMTAAGDFSSLVAEASQNTLAINPLIGLTPRDVAGAATSLLKVMSKAPGKTVAHYGSYLKELAKVAGGKS